MMYLVKTIPEQTNKILTSSLVLKVSSIFVFGLHLLLTAVALYCVVKYGRNIPLAEDWLLIAPYTGNESDLLGWLWAQNNEHRVPLPKLVLLGLMKLTNGDFRAGMYFNVLALSGISLAFLLFLRKQRGYTHLSDAFFPLLLLHLGNWENMVWSWQLSFVLPTILMLIFLLVALKNPLLDKPGNAFTCGIILILLPFCGGNGVLLVPFLGTWLVCCAVSLQRTSSNNSAKNVSVILFGFAIIATLICLLYFIGYKKPDWSLPNPGILPTLLTSGKFLAYSLGPAAYSHWGLFSFTAILIVLISIIILLNRSFSYQLLKSDPRKLLLLIFFSLFLFFALAIGWGRAALVPTVGMPIRYIIFSSPLLIICYFTWELYGRSYLKPMMLTGLMAIMLFLLPFNARAAFYWRDWYTNGMNAVENDITAGLTKADIARKHKAFLIHWWEEKEIISHLQMLQNTSHSPFRQLRDKSPSTIQLQGK
ncbi:hypothetical protein GXP67_33540 [Rhodocytophaga rosea]|uniref:Glycosyltransferase RgtA/B/C/D-like domain-containing protein n=1 Tax=Rhodocytophaga rosea TaxID=2704465 RepID=A0A6C0GSU8_9BACT|nr:hypothetical protein [Rhodocytophaga rosea]QHT71228.1 hypothetical protein GXP67_33540 [Rhodocytophaga rosea]